MDIVGVWDIRFDEYSEVWGMGCDEFSGVWGWDVQSEQFSFKNKCHSPE